MTVPVRRAAAEQIEREMREATGFADLPVIEVMVRRGDWRIIDDQPAAVGMARGVA